MIYGIVGFECSHDLSVQFADVRSRAWERQQFFKSDGSIQRIILRDDDWLDPQKDEQDGKATHSAISPREGFEMMNFPCTFVCQRNPDSAEMWPTRASAADQGVHPPLKLPQFIAL
jgi:hypothetical protein